MFGVVGSIGWEGVFRMPQSKTVLPGDGARHFNRSVGQLESVYKLPPCKTVHYFEGKFLVNMITSISSLRARD